MQLVISVQVHELAEKESENGVFKMLCNDVTRFLTTILIGTIVVNIGATALVTEAATTIFGEAGVSAATGVMTAFGFIPKTGESIKVVLEKEEDHDEYTEDDSDRQNQKEKEKTQIFQIEILAGNARKVGAVRFERVTHEEETKKDAKKLEPKIMKRKWGGGDESENENGRIRIEDENHVIP